MKFTLIALLSLVSSLASARMLNEVHFGTMGNGALRSEKAGKDTVTVIGARGSYLVQLREELQVGGEAAFFSTSGGAKSQSYFEAAGVGAWNFSRDLSTSIFAKGGVGLFAVLNEKAEYENKLGLFVGGGKRFPLWTNVNYAPEVRIYKKGNIDPSFEILFINVSVLF